MTNPAISTIFPSDSALETVCAAASELGVRAELALGVCAVDAMPVGLEGVCCFAVGCAVAADCAEESGCGARASLDPFTTGTGGLGAPVESPQPVSAVSEATMSNESAADFISIG